MKQKRKFGDRKDARWMKNEVTGLQTIMAHMFPNRTECEVSIYEQLDITALKQWLDEKNRQHPEYKTTFFHCYLFAIAKMLKERPLLNSYVSGRRYYMRHDITLGFVAKRRFIDHSEEALMIMKVQDNDTIDTFSYQIAGKVYEAKKTEKATGGLDAFLNQAARVPRPILMGAAKALKIMDFCGLTPRAIMEGDVDYVSVLASNLGSIKAPPVYHHLNNYGTTGLMTTLGIMRQEEKKMEDGSMAMRDVVDFSFTADERIADGFYLAKSLNIMKELMAHPELLDLPLVEPSGLVQ